MRKLIAGMKLPLDGRIDGTDGAANWVEAWSGDYGLMPKVDACLIGGTMYSGYERDWSPIRSNPGTPA